ncbi:hypothetical protein WMY93_018711 [Mugilogobius chulae]|uniref:Ig-like domain-containing protein n=1 Tax=Mugilogobius chulae TaxID=88201 RepID=A0AAW0NVP2_9GOBI
MFRSSHTREVPLRFRISFAGEPWGKGQGGINGHVFSCRRKPEYPEETYADTGRTCKLHIERPWPARESNPGPSCYEARALTACATVSPNPLQGWTAGRDNILRSVIVVQGPRKNPQIEMDWSRAEEVPPTRFDELRMTDIFQDRRNFMKCLDFNPRPFKEMDMSHSPKFTAPLVDRTVVAGYTTAISCAVRGFPRPKIVWMKNNMIIGEDPKFLMQNNQGVLTLRIRKPSLFDGGRYVCRAINDLGQDEVECKLEVRVVQEKEEVKAK